MNTDAHRFERIISVSICGNLCPPSMSNEIRLTPVCVTGSLVGDVYGIVGIEPLLPRLCAQQYIQALDI